jgi:oligopeptide transport system substrate-binding protein
MSAHPALAFLALGALAIAGCARHETAVEAGYRTAVLHVGNSAEPPDLDPHTSNAANTGWICDALFERLVRLASDGVAIQPGVAEKWEISPDGLTYTFHLRASALWSNGDTITAGDFLAAFRRFLEPKLGCEAVNLTFPIVGARDFAEGRSKDFSAVGVKAPDSHTIVIQLQFRAPYFLTVLTDAHFSPLHQPSLDRFNAREQRGGKWTQPGNLISNGPFVLQSWQPNTVLVVRKNPRYWDADRVRLQEIRFYPIDDVGAEEHAFRTGQLHVTYTLPFNKLAAYAQRHAPELRTAPVLRTDFVTFATQRPPFNDARVRRAFALAIDRERLAATVLKGRGTPAFSYVRPGTGGYSFPPFSRYDPGEAKKLLREAGFPDGAGFPAVEYTLGSRSEDVLLLGQALQQMWQQTLGVKVTLAPTEFKVWLDLLRAKSFAITADEWNMGFNDPADMLAMGVTGDPNNDAGWSDPRYDAAFAAVQRAPDEAARRAAIASCEQLIADEAPYAPVFFTIRAHLVAPGVVGWQENALQTIDWTALSLAAPK